MKKIITVSLILVLFIYSFMGITCLLLFGKLIEANILKIIGKESIILSSKSDSIECLIL